MEVRRALDQLFSRISVLGPVVAPVPSERSRQDAQARRLPLRQLRRVTKAL
jgi:hypothetical protein